MICLTVGQSNPMVFTDCLAHCAATRQSQGRIITMRICLAAILAVSTAVLSGGPVQAQEKPTPVSIVVFGPPSLGAFLPPVIKTQEFDLAHGVDITFAERTPDAYAAQFNSGEFKVGGSAALLTVGLAESRGIEASYLFNLFDFWGAVVTTRDNVNSLADLE